MTAMTESFKIVKSYIAMNAGKVEPIEVLKACNKWFTTFNEFQVRDEFKGSRMLPSQLDIFDKAKERVLAVRLNACHAMLDY